VFFISKEKIRTKWNLSNEISLVMQVPVEKKSIWISDPGLDDTLFGIIAGENKKGEEPQVTLRP
jgi:hypothetical protein